MPLIGTKYFGPAECAPDLVFQFPLGLPGFEQEREFVFLDRPETHPLLYMQSVSNPGLCFILLPILAADPHYRLTWLAEDKATLQLDPAKEPEIGKDILCAGVLCAADESRPAPTVNLLAPIVLNLHNRTGMQVIQSESGYSHRHPLFVPQEAATC